MTSRNVVEGLFSTKPATLLASRCDPCGSVFFPRRRFCRNPDCVRAPLRDVALSGSGTLYSFTVQHYPPPAPFRLDPALLPYAVALVDFPEGVRVMGIVAEDTSLDGLRIGMRMRVTTGRLFTNADGADTLTWKFRPAIAGTDTKSAP